MASGHHRGLQNLRLNSWANHNSWRTTQSPLDALHIGEEEIMPIIGKRFVTVRHRFRYEGIS
jgi:hypothetical protein